MATFVKHFIACVVVLVLLFLASIDEFEAVHFVALIGLSADVPFAEKWIWNIKGDVGFGESEGTYLASTGLTWRFYGGWSATLFGKYVAVEFENDSKGDSDWYLYDVDESTLGLTILYNW